MICINIKEPKYDLGTGCQNVQGSKAYYIIQTGLTGSTRYDLSFNPVILSRISKPQMNADERRLIVSGHRKGREERKAQQQKSLHKGIEIIPRRRTRMIRIGRIFTDDLIAE